MSFDIYLVDTCETLPSPEELACVGLQSASAETLTGDGFSFLGVDFPTREHAQRARDVLRSHGARSQLVDSRYRTPCVSLEEARVLAEREIERLKPLSGDVDWEPTTFHDERGAVWTFRANSPTLIERGCIPGAVFVSIDKLDGHPWSREEFDVQ